jgi:ATP-dependent RNA helicase DDX27
LKLISVKIPISVDDIIARRRSISKRKKTQIEEDSEEDSEDSDNEVSESEEDGHSSAEESIQLEPEIDEAENEARISGSESDDDPLATSGEDSIIEEEENDPEKAESSEDDDDSESETQAEKDRKTAYFDQETPASKRVHNSFLSMNLSRPVMKALTNLGFNKPTPIQASTIPVALLGKDVVGNAVTGSGKTAAFMIPMIERLLFREKGKKAAATRCLVLVPTRELAVQCYEVGTKLSIHTDIRFCLVVGTMFIFSSFLLEAHGESSGGFSLKSQEAALWSRPDVAIATPGRLIDHIRNSASFSLDALDILVIDEADRILSEGFSDELTEIIRSCPKSRQTMLFSATMTDSVDELVRVSLNKPARLFVDPKRTTARGLVQEFVRVRAGKEAERSAMLVTMCKRTFKRRVIVFLRSKKLAHQMRIVFSLLGMRCEELHGDLTQEQACLTTFTSVDGIHGADLYPEAFKSTSALP